MNTARYIKSFSKGQITIPKEIRDEFGMSNDFWLKLYTHEGKIIAEPIDNKMNKTEWRKKLLKIEPISLDAEELKKNRDQVNRQVKSREL